MKKIKLKQEEFKNTNDCWARTLSRALNTPYEDVRNLFKPFIEPAGGLRLSFIEGVLHREGFTSITFEDDLTVKQVVKAFDSRYNHLVVSIQDHVFYVDNKIIIDVNKEIEDMLIKKVDEVFVKEK